MKPRITWDAELFGVKIETKKEAFVISANPNMEMSWHDARRFFQDDKVWQLPSIAQLVLVAEHIIEINSIISANGGYMISGWFWTAEDKTKHFEDTLAWFVRMSSGDVGPEYKDELYSVRPISILS